MQYQISYFSPSGHTEKMTAALEKILPPNTVTVDLNKETETSGEIHIIGFELGSKLDAIPYKVLDFLEKLDEKVILLFCTCPVQPMESIKERTERAIIPFLPDDCDYRGLYMCRGQVPERFQAELDRIAKTQPDNDNVRVWINQCKKSEGHPNDEDARNLCQFAAEVLELNA